MPLHEVHTPARSAEEQYGLSNKSSCESSSTTTEPTCRSRSLPTKREHQVHVLAVDVSLSLWADREIRFDRAGFAEFFFYTREQPADWRGAGVREVQGAVNGDCYEGLLSFDATECTKVPRGSRVLGDRRRCRMGDGRGW